MLRQRRTRALITIGSMLVLGMLSMAMFEECRSQDQGLTPVICVNYPQKGSDQTCVDSGSDPGGGGPPTDPYSWIEDLPAPGQTPTQLTAWCYYAGGGCTPFVFSFYGSVTETYGLSDPATVSLEVNEALMAFFVTAGAPWIWKGTTLSDTLYSQHLAIYTAYYQLTCPTLSPPVPDSWVGAYACSRFPAVHLVGGNANLNITLGTDSEDLSIAPLWGWSLDYRHKIAP